MLLKLLLAHVCDSSVCPVLVTIRKVGIVHRHVVDEEVETADVGPESIQQKPYLFSLSLLISVRREHVRYGSLVHHSCGTCSFQCSLIFIEKLTGKSCIH